MTRAESKQQTREAVLAAAREVFARDGFHGATLDRVAEQAGFTKGAVYSAFASKADLFMAVYEARVAERSARALEEHSTFAESAAATVGEWRQIMREQRGWSAALTEFWVYASRRPELRQRFRAAHLAWRRTLGSSIEAAAAAEGRRLPLSGERLATAIMALGNGLALEGLLGDDESDLLEVVLAGLT
jgi:AcrR family transcriptional regulator